MISNKDYRTIIPEKFERTPKEIQAERPKPGRPAYIFHQIGQGNLPGIEYSEPARLQKGHGDWPRVQAGRSHLSASPREPSRGAGSIPLLPYPSCFRSNSS